MIVAWVLLTENLNHLRSREPMPPAENSTQASCPFHSAAVPPRLVDPDDELVLPMNKRTVAQYSTNEDGATELHLYYGDKEISFDETDLFAFGEQLAQQSRFVARTATTWGGNHAWPRVQALLKQLIEAGVLRYAENVADVIESPAQDGARASPLPPAQTTVARTWLECEDITSALTGRRLELGYLEMVIPIFRVAHMSLDADGRQVGEANVFPKALRLDTPTNWRTCIYSGTRFQTERPMNVTALKSMRAHWAQMMAALLHIREAYLNRFPEARSGWSVGHLERLATVVLAVPTYALMRSEARVENGHLHPALSSLFRVTDGLRMTMHQMLFVPIGEPTLAAQAPMTSAEIFAYAERNYSFHSDHGVCAGPKVMIEEFLSVLVDGQPARGTDNLVLEPKVAAALDDVQAAIDYGLYGLQIYAAIFSVWPIMTRAYQQAWSIVQTWSAPETPSFAQFRERLRGRVEQVRTSTYLATEQWRVDRETVYADMYANCTHGLGVVNAPSLSEQIAPRHTTQHLHFKQQLRTVLRQHFGYAADIEAASLDSLLACLMDFFVQQQAILKVACEAQQRVNALLGRAAPSRPFSVAEIDIHNMLQGKEGRRLPYLVDELQDIFRIQIAINKDTMTLASASATA